VTFHPRERPGSQPIARRTFLRRSAYTAAAVAVGPTLLAACGGDDGGGGGGGGGQAVQLSRPDNPVTLPLFDDIPAIEDGLEPEPGTLRVFNYAAYIAPAVLRGFRRDYGVDVEVTTFNSMDEAIARLSGGQARFDVFFATTDVIGKVVLGRLLQPLNSSYLTNTSNVWAQLQDPFYDVGAQYSRPYTMYTTGIGYRIDRVEQPPDAYDNPYDILWDPTYRGDTYVLEDDREVLGMALLRQGETDVNTEDPGLIDGALDDVLQLTDDVNVRVGIEAYTILPEGRATLHQAWAGDLVNAQYYLPEGESIDNIGYWYPADGGGMIGSDQLTVMAGAEHPVLAHHFINYLLDADHALANFSWLGYQPPQVSIDPESVVADGLVPAHLDTTVIRPEDFDTGYQLLQLTLDGERLWDNAWSTFTAGA
jgi:spermidine/putrescine transport system substrate-binding protein